MDKNKTKIQSSDLQSRCSVQTSLINLSTLIIDPINTAYHLPDKIFNNQSNPYMIKRLIVYKLMFSNRSNLYSIKQLIAYKLKLRILFRNHLRRYKYRLKARDDCQHRHRHHQRVINFKTQRATRSRATSRDKYNS